MAISFTHHMKSGFITEAHLVEVVIFSVYPRKNVGSEVPSTVASNFLHFLKELQFVHLQF
jgi:hypothetical protein